VAPCKSTLRKKRNLTTDIQQQLTSTKKKLGRSLGRTKKSILKKSALLVRLIVNIMEEIEKNLSNTINAGVYPVYVL
jgi:hypothetical protein